jgi:hypothetical protein
MRAFRTTLAFAAILLSVLCLAAMACEEQGLRGSLPDRPEEEDVLNRELWQFAKGTPYEDAERHIEKARKIKPPASAKEKEVVLPNGWTISPAGAQVEVGRLPEEAVFYAGRIVVLNTGYYGNSLSVPQEISIVDPTSGKAVKVLRQSSLFPCAAPGLDGDLYVSGGYSQSIYRYDNKFKLNPTSAVAGFFDKFCPSFGGRAAVSC